jgi:hypothetical protein
MFAVQNVLPSLGGWGCLASGRPRFGRSRPPLIRGPPCSETAEDALTTSIDRAEQTTNNVKRLSEPDFPCKTRPMR